MGDIDSGIENLRALIDQAHYELGEVCAKGPHNRFRMSVPARPDHDSDLVISAGLDAGEEALDRLAAAEARTRELEATVQRVEAPHKPYFPTAADEAWNTNQRCEECGQQFPCKTIRALRGSDV